MKFDKLIFRGPNRSGRHIRVTVDFGIGEITAQSMSGGEVMWSRLTGYRGTVLRMKLDACDFESQFQSGSGSGIISGGQQELEMSADEWSLDFCSGEQNVKHLNGIGNPAEQSYGFASINDLCLSFAENRSVGQRVPLYPGPAY